MILKGCRRLYKCRRKRARRKETRESMSKYMVLLYANEAGLPRPGTPEFEVQNAAYGAVYENFSSRGVFVADDPLGPSAAATSVRVRNGQAAKSSGPAAAGAE